GLVTCQRHHCLPNDHFEPRAKIIFPTIDRHIKNSNPISTALSTVLDRTGLAITRITSGNLPSAGVQDYSKKREHKTYGHSTIRSLLALPLRSLSADGLVRPERWNHPTQWPQMSIYRLSFCCIPRWFLFMLSRNSIKAPSGGRYSGKDFNHRS